MNNLEQWLKLYRSENPIIRIRAGEGLLRMGSEIPLPMLLSILDTLSNEGLGAATESVLKRRRDKELVREMISRLRSSHDFVREMACEVLGAQGDRMATSHLLEMLNDPRLMVRRAATLALGSLGDSASGSELKKEDFFQKDGLKFEVANRSALSQLGLAGERSARDAR